MRLGKIWILCVGVVFVLGYAGGCAKPEYDEPALTYVNGNAVFGTQCPYGSLSNPLATPLYLWDCPLGIKTVELAQPLRPIVLQGDCKKKTVIARTLDGKLDTSWEVLPDGTFSFTIDGGYAVLRDDGSGNRDCSVRLAAELNGRMICGDRDKIKLVVESIWWLDRSVPPIHASPSPMPTLSPLPTSTPTGTPTPFPTITITPTPTSTPTPTGTPTVTPTSTSTPVPAPTATHHILIDVPAYGSEPTGPKCRVHRGCYFFSLAEMNQCE